MLNAIRLWWRYDVRDGIRRALEKAQIWLAWHSPRWLVRWCVVRAAVAVPNSNPDVTYEQMAKAIG